MPPVIQANRCVHCGTCAAICPMDVLYMETVDGVKLPRVRYPYECWHCRACVTDCPAGAVEMYYPISHMMLTMPPVEKEGR
ncbi:MAG: ferredoxin family protein [Oscillospiraceae bacterium]|nr:ferredoxin family protein [Oscillospiraceae bacterium]